MVKLDEIGKTLSLLGNSDDSEEGFRQSIYDPHERTVSKPMQVEYPIVESGPER